MENVTATVIYPVYVNIDLDPSLSEDEKRDKILDMADKMFDSSSIDPVIHECSDPELID